MKVETFYNDKGNLKLQIDPYELMHNICTGEHREILIESLSCADDVIEHVCSQLIDGYTNNAFSGNWCSDRETTLQKTRQKIAENSDYAVKKTIEEMQQQIDSLKSDLAYCRSDEYFESLRARRC